MPDMYGRVVRSQRGSTIIEVDDETVVEMCAGALVQKPKKYHLMYDGFLPLIEGDAILVVYEEGKKNEVSVSPSKRPIVRMSKKRDDIVRYFFIANPKKSKGDPEKTGAITMKQAEKFYDELAEFYDDPSVQLDRMAESYNKVRSRDINHYCIPNNAVKRVLKWWYRNRVLRKFYLLGLRLSDFTGTEGTLDEVYKQITTNPFRVVSLSMENCLSIIDTLGIVLSDEEQMSGIAIRQIYENVRKKAWSMTPILRVEEVCPKYKMVKPLLERYYGIREEYDSVILPRQRDAETMVAKFLMTMKDLPAVCLDEDDIRTFSNLTDEQNHAIHTAVTNGVSILTGYAGTGKTTTISHLVTVLEENGIEYILVSFTGKAVSRIREVTGIEKASTFHRLINSIEQVPKFKYIIIDETSMVTTDLFYQFIRQVIRFNGPCNVAMIGDVGQLQPITWGCLMDSCIKSQAFPVVNLTEIKRTDNDISHLTLGMTYGIVPTNVSGNGYRIQIGEVEDVIHLVKQFRAEGVMSRDIKIVCPYNKLLQEINTEVQQIYTGENAFHVDPAGNRWNEGDIVMMCENNYTLNIMNGTEGEVVHVDAFKLHVKFFFPEKVCEFNHISESVLEGRKKLDQNDPVTDQLEDLASHRLHLSYAITVHKAQGSEWERVIYYCPQGVVTGDFLNRNLTYTGCTRAKSELFIVCDYPTFQKSLRTEKSCRHESLDKRIRDNSIYFEFDERRDERPEFSSEEAGPGIEAAAKRIMDAEMLEYEQSKR